MDQQKRTRLFIILAVIASVYLIIYSIYSATRKYTADIITIPNFTKVTVDGKNVKAGKINLSPGVHEIEGSAEGFETVKKMVTIQDNAPIKKITVFPNPDSDSALQWAAANPDIIKNRERLAGEEARSEGDRFRNTNKITSQLPYRSLIFNIDYGISKTNPDDLILYIKAPSALDRQYAIAQIKDWGYDPSLYTIIFTEFANPLGVK
jgi:hypothetical protein